MDQKHMDKIDIERCKELFEYEMTEVVLMLKGEFAAVSGKDLGLSQYRISDEKRNAYKMVSPIPTIEVQPVAIPKTLRDKPVSPNLSIQTDPVKLAISVPAQKQFQYSGVLPQIQVETLCQLDIPHPSRTSFPRRAQVRCTAAQIGVSAIQETPRMNIPPMDTAPMAVEIPEVTSFAQATKSISTIPESIAPDKITIPEVPALSIPVVALSPKTIDVPKIRKVSAPNLRQAPEEYSARDIIATMVADAEKLCTTLPKIDFSGITKREIKTAVHFFEPVKRVTVRPACATIDAPAQPLAVPDRPCLEARQSIAVGEMKGLSDAIIQAMHDLNKELDDM